MKNGKNKNVLEIDVEKDGGIIFLRKKIKRNKEYPFKEENYKIVLSTSVLINNFS